MTPIDALRRAIAHFAARAMAEPNPEKAGEANQVYMGLRDLYEEHLERTGKPEGEGWPP